MDDTSGIPQLDALLAHADWVRSLARRLVTDPNDADDIEQRAWLVAARRPPKHLASARGWFARVVRRLAKDAGRSSSRRPFSMQDSVPDDSASGSSEIVAQAEAHREVVEVLLSLREPYRSTILHRFFRGTSSAEIARHEGIPAQTVRVRLHRGLSMLREALDSRHGKDRAWPMLVTLADIPNSALPSVANGVIAMTGKKIIVTTAAIAALVGLVAISTGEDDANAEAEGRHRNVSRGAKDAEERMSAGPQIQTSRFDEAPESQAPTDQRRGVARHILAGRVVDNVTGTAVTSYHLQLWRRSNPGIKSEVVARRTINDARGNFRLALRRGGVHRLRISSSRHRTATLDALDVSDPEGLDGLEVRLDPGESISGRVVDHHTDRPVEGAIVGTARDSDLRVLLIGEPQRLIHAVTNADGEFVLSGLSPEDQKIAAVHDEYAEAWRQVLPGQETGVEIRLKRGPCVFGTVFDDSGRPREGVWITAIGSEMPMQRSVVSGPDGKYRTPPVRPGVVELCARPPSGSTERAFGFSSEWQVAEIEGEDVQVDFGVETDYATWRGTLYGKDGRPIPRAIVVIFLSRPRFVDSQLLKSSSRSAMADAQGHFEFRKVPLGHYRILVRPIEGARFDYREGFAVDAPGLVERDIHFADGNERRSLGGIRGAVVDATTGAPIQGGGRATVHASAYTPSFRTHSSELDDNGRFHLRDLPPGAYSIHSAVEGRVFVRKSVVVQAGEVVENVRLALPPCGRLRLTLSEFSDAHPREFRFQLAAAGGGRVSTGTGKLADNGAWQTARPIEVGAWIATVAFGQRLVERPFTSHPGRITEVMIRPDDLLLVTKTWNLDGTFTREDGTPIVGATVSLSGEHVAGIHDAERSKTAVTGSSGRFSMTGLRPGRWLVQARSREGLTSVHRDLLLAVKSADPVRLALVLPSGSLTGVLFDKATDRPLGVSASFQLFLSDLASLRKVGETRGKSGPRFEMEGVPSGDYRLTAVTAGYRNSFKVFQHAGKGRVDLGRIHLEPCGALDFEVEGEDGVPVPKFRVLLGGKIVPHSRTSKGNNRYVLGQLPVGTVTVEVLAEGYNTARDTLTLDAGKPVTHRFVLKRR